MLLKNIPDFNHKRILVVGDVMLDKYWSGACQRISPEAPVPVVKVESLQEKPGGAANVAINMAELGCQVSLQGVVGDDEAAATLFKKLNENKISSDFVIDDNNTTIIKLRILSQHQQLLRVDFERDVLHFDPEHLLKRFQNHLPNSDIVVLSDYGKGTLREVRSLIGEARRHGLKVLVDPKGADFSRYYGATLITPNMSEFQAVVGSCRNDSELEERGLQLIRDLALEALLITRSEKGISLLQRQQPALHLPAQAREVFDVTGAGDTVISVLAASLAAGVNIGEATQLANWAAGIVVGKLGAAHVSMAELRRFYQKYDFSAPSAIVDEDTLLKKLEEARQQNEKIVMTNGCFDILHAGHVSYLEQARQLGDRLIVAVNDDASVSRLKGPARPVNTLSQRMQVLAGLNSVDWVVPFYEDTPERLICRVKPDFLVKGGDNNPANIPGNHCVWEAGGQVIVMDYVEGCSTTNIINRILN